MAAPNRYPAQVFWSDEDESFVAVATDLPGCSALGDTQESALKELQGAITEWISAQEAAGNPIPAPSSPAQQHSGKVLVRMPRSLHSTLSLRASSEGVSLNQYIVFVLSSGAPLAPALWPQRSGRFLSWPPTDALTMHELWAMEAHGTRATTIGLNKELVSFTGPGQRQWWGGGTEPPTRPRVKRTTRP
jgi:antitoxin HicB